MELSAIREIGVAAALGLLVGFQREWTAPHVAGLRTFSLITVLGTINGLLADHVGGWLIAAGLLAVTALLIGGSLLKFGNTQMEPGLTTEVAALVMYLVGVLIALDAMMPGVIVAGGTAVLLHWKKPLHAVVARIGEGDIRAIIQLVLIALVILPLVPNHGYGPQGVLNPFEIWMMVVLIVGISLGGFIGYRFLGGRAGALLCGVLGGLISSTATTVSYAHRTRRAPDSSATAALIIMVASTIVFGRVLLEIALVAPETLRHIFPPLAAMMAWMVLVSAGLYVARLGAVEPLETDENPSELKAAVAFGLLYAAVLLAVAVVKERYGDQGLFVVASLSGLTDMDAITLSTAQMIRRDQLQISTGWRMILVGALSNLAFKGVAVAILGHRRLWGRLAIAFGISFAGGGLLLAFWP